MLSGMHSWEPNPHHTGCSEPVEGQNTNIFSKKHLRVRKLKITPQKMRNIFPVLLASVTRT